MIISDIFSTIFQSELSVWIFENWYQSGFWNDKYIPYSILADGKIISNVSVNIIDCSINGNERRFIQLGTIMTEICSLFGSDIKKAEFAFIPENNSSLEKYLYTEDDTTFFVLGDTLTNDLPDILSFPSLVHA